MVPVQALPQAAQALVRYGERQGLPTALVAGAALAALAAAVGRAVDIEVSASWHERAILWVPPLAPRGAGKSPSLSMAFAPLRERDERLEDDDEEEKAILLGDLTLEALARRLSVVQGAAALDLDELAYCCEGWANTSAASAATVVASRSADRRSLAVRASGRQGRAQERCQPADLAPHAGHLRRAPGGAS